MQHKREQIQQQMTLLPPLESFIPADHYLRRLNRVLDLEFIHETVRDCYCQDNGRPSIDPEVVIRLFLIQAIEGIPHVRELMRQVQMHLGYRWFIGYELDEKLPDHSTLSKALDRFGDKVFNELFERSVFQCKHSGLIEGRMLHVDATTIRADIDANRVGKQWHSLGRAWRRGLSKVLVQSLLVATVLNLKRLAVGYSGFGALNIVCRALLNLITRLVSQLWCSNTNKSQPAHLLYYAT